MTYDASTRGGGHWVMTFMRFDPSGGHDGFTVFDSREVSGQVSGTLERGQWYAVGMYREEGRWVCAGPAQENHQFVAGNRARPVLWNGGRWLRRQADRARRRAGQPRRIERLSRAAGITR